MGALDACRASLALVTVLALNVALSVTLVLLNKLVVVRYEFDYMSFLTGLHFLTSMMASIVLVLIGIIKFKPVKSYFHIFRISLGSLLSVVFMNYCLANSSIGFYQISKLGCIPVTLLMETLLGCRQQNVTFGLISSLLLLVAGMALVVQQEVVFSDAGILWAFAGVVTTSAAQIYFAPLKRELELDALQLLFHTSPWLTFGSFMIIPLVGDVEGFLNYRLDMDVIAAIGMTCVVAVAFNVSNYSVLTSISPLSYTVLSHVKTLTIVVAGSYLFQQWPSTQMATGMFLAVLGVALYTAECETQAANRSIAQSAAGGLPSILSTKV